MDSLSINQNNQKNNQKNYKMHTTDGEIVLIPYSEVTTKFLPLQIVKAIEYNQYQNQNQNKDMIIETSVTSRGLEYIRSFKRTGFWPLEATAKSAIIPDFEFSEAIDYLMIDEQPIFLLSSLSEYLMTYIDNNSVYSLTPLGILQITINITCSDRGIITLDLYDFSPSILMDPNSPWNEGLIYKIDPDIQHISSKLKKHGSTIINIFISLSYDEVEFILFQLEKYHSKCDCIQCKKYI